MTALAMDVRELSFEEVDYVSGGDADAESFAQSVAAGLLVVALVAAPVVTIGVIAVVVVVAGATAAN
ncbi:hypothetical protein [uncultured Brevundimonas sp.]|uniref:hypothetical protein n=1 Tax=uncultured Brevundimonas sp. TaxID=213418 RepID=UPI0030EE0ECE